MDIGPYTVDVTDRKEGGQAFVYFGVDRGTGRHVAIKVARPSEWSHKRMRREISIQQRLDHPNILPIIGHDGGRRWYAMSLAQASLEEIGPFPKEEWTRLRVGLLAIADAVKYAHDRGYVHRDLSPGNVLIFPDRWVVADWGFVYEEPSGGSRMTQPLERFGTPEFTAPELLVDPRDVRASADVFSIGRLAAWGTGLRHGEAHPSDDSLTRWWRALIDGAAAYDPRMRWTMQDVLAHLRAAPTLVRSKPTRVGTAGDVCPRCHSQAGIDQAGRCLTCHGLTPD